MTKSIFESLLRKNKAIEILINLKQSKREKYAYNFSRSLNITYPHINKLIQQLDDMKLISRERLGQKIILNLTKKGEVVTEKLIELKEILK